MSPWSSLEEEEAEIISPMYIVVFIKNNLTLEVKLTYDSPLEGARVKLFGLMPATRGMKMLECKQHEENQNGGQIIWVKKKIKGQCP